MSANHPFGTYANLVCIQRLRAFVLRDGVVMGSFTDLATRSPALSPAVYRSGMAMGAQRSARGNSQ